MRIAFLSNQLDNRGTGNAVLDYAHHAERILGAESYIFTLRDVQHDDMMLEKVYGRFGNIFEFPNWPKVDVFYHIKSGADDGMERVARTVADKYAVHAVFENHPHGDAYATISPWMGKRFDIPWVPHLVQSVIPDPVDVGTVRSINGIPQDAVVFGRLGGRDTFDISWVWDAIEEDVKRNPNHYYLFVNTEIPRQIDNVVAIGQQNRYWKAALIHASDYMLHARGRGETFGLAVGEFAVAGVPVITYGQSAEKAHLDLLGHAAIKYDTKEELVEILNKPPEVDPFNGHSGYDTFTSPGYVMYKFKDVFL